jgi:DNA-directed RNA polymerase subunit RPC12/RpoP
VSCNALITDKHLTCADCGKDFIWTADEQQFYEQRQFQAPKRCRECRQEVRNRKRHKVR